MEKTDKLQEIIDLAKKSLEAVKILGDKDWKSERARQAVLDIERMEKKLNGH